MANDNIAVQKLKLGIGLPNSGSMYVYAKQYDGNSRKIVAEILDSDGPISLAGNSVRLNATLPNGEKLYMNGQVEDNKATFLLTADFLALDGTAACDISVINDTGDGLLLTSSTFYIVVSQSNFDENAPGSYPSSVVVSTMLKPDMATEGNIAVFDNNKNVVDSGKSVSDFAPSAENGYVEKQTTPASNPRAYIYTKEGDSYLPVIRANNDPKSIVQRTTGGQIVTGDPTYDNHAATKKYVDDRVQANPTDASTADLTKLKVGDTTYNIPSGGGSAGVSSIGGATGAISLGTGMSMSGQTLNGPDLSGYVEKQTSTSGSWRAYVYNNAGDNSLLVTSGGDGTAAPTGTGIAATTGGKLRTNTPTGPYHAANKKYVDERVVANPSGAPTATLTSIQIGGTIYSVGQQTCLIKGTNILMADGSEKPIELVRSGEMIKSYDPTTKEQIDAVVISAYKTGASRGFFVYNFSDGKHLTIYGDHKYFNPNAEELRPFSKVKPDVINGCSAFLNSEMSKVFCSQAITRNYQGELREHYNIITSNNLYFANGILCGHNPCDKYNYFVNRDIHTNLPPDVRALLNHSCDEYNSYDGLCENPEYLEATRQSRNSFRHAVQAIKRARAELDRLDYKCMKYNEGALSEEEYQEVVARKAELRAIVNEKRPTFRSTLNEIKETNNQFRLPSRSALFKACCDHDNAALNQYVEWLTPVGEEETNDEVE